MGCLINIKDHLSCSDALLAGQNIFLNSWRSPWAFPTQFPHKKTLFHHFSEAGESTQAAWCSLSHASEKTWHRFSPSQREGTGIQWWSIQVPQAAKQEIHRQHKQTQHYLKSTDQTAWFSDLPPRSKNLFLTDTKRALWKPSKWGPLGLTHLKKAELSVKGKDQRERGTCWIISWIWLRISRQRKIQDLPYWTSLLYPCQKVSCALCYLSYPGGKGKERKII